MLKIGIDPGCDTGIAIFNSEKKELQEVSSVKIHKAMNTIILLKDDISIVRVEDARKRKWFGESGKEVLQGAGSIKRDCKIWEDFLKDLGVNYEMVPPRFNKTKISHDLFVKITKWEKRTNEHARDAAMLIVEQK